MTTDRVRRRHAIAAAVGLSATPLLAACGGDASRDSEGSPGALSGGGAIPTSDVPVGGGVILDEPKVVVTQPTEGEFKAFSSICTHQGCPVGKVEGGQIVCPCHGSAFSAQDGSVVNGPATEPLEVVPLDVQGGEITLA